jgi:hypothetical protein
MLDISVRTVPLHGSCVNDSSICSPHAHCTSDGTCVCSDNYTGNGQSCYITDCARCSPHADCDALGAVDGHKVYSCRCRQEYIGDGLTCTLAIVQNPCSACAADAICLQDVCICREGFEGDGRMCTKQTGTTDCVLHFDKCHKFAQCDTVTKRCMCRLGEN